MKNREIERKYAITEYEFLRLADTLSFKLDPVIEMATEGSDTFFLGKNSYIYRYRNSADGFNEMTVKSYGGDTLNRMEVNLPMGKPSMTDLIQFFSTLGLQYAGSVDKEAVIYKLPKGDVSLYKATTGASTKYFLEIEAHSNNEKEALEFINYYETEIGLEAASRQNFNLYDLMIGGK
jgi:adenylate cyclase class IV